MSRKRSAPPPSGDLFDALPGAPVPTASAPQRFLRPNPVAQAQLFDAPAAPHAPQGLGAAKASASPRHAAPDAASAGEPVPARPTPAAPPPHPAAPTRAWAPDVSPPLLAAFPNPSDMPQPPELDVPPPWSDDDWQGLNDGWSAQAEPLPEPPAWQGEAFGSVDARARDATPWVDVPGAFDAVDLPEPPQAVALRTEWADGPDAAWPGDWQGGLDDDGDAFDDAGIAQAPEATLSVVAAHARIDDASEAPSPDWSDLPEADWQAPDALARLQAHLAAWRAHDQLRSLDGALAEFLLSLEPGMPPLALLGAVLASHQLGRGHVCLDLPQVLKYGARALGWRRVVLAEAGAAHAARTEAPPLAMVGTATPAAVAATTFVATTVTAPAGTVQADGPAAAAHMQGDVEALPHDPWADANDALVMAASPSDPDWGDWPTDAAGAMAVAAAPIDPALEGPADSGAASPTDPATEVPLLALPSPMDWLRGVTIGDWQAQLAHSSLVQASAGNSPLVLAGPRLYLRREWQDEQVVREAIMRRMVHAGSMRAQRAPAQWRAALDALFGPVPSDPRADMDWQKAACALAASQGFSIITGGPGTGKTTTVVKLLALLQGLSMAQAQGRTLRIELAAPTGKAAARLGDAIGDAVDRLQLGQLAQALGLRDAPPALPPGVSVEGLLRQAIPTQARTLHRLLGSQPESRHFRHNARNPLPLDVLVVDEASMVDLDMMARLLQALPAHARLVLLGDKDQLSSVEAGAVLGELCSRAQRGHFLPETAQWLQAVTGQAVPAALQDANGTPLDQAVVMLRRSHRFDGQSGIGRLASVVNAGDVAAVEAMRQHPLADLRWLRVDDPKAPALAQLVRDGGHWPIAINPATPERGHGDAPRGDAPHGYAHYLRVMAEGEAQWRAAHAAQTHLPIDEAALAQWALRVLEAQRQFQLLCALREGPWGVSGLNRRITQVLADAQLVQPKGEWWAGRPVMVTGNDYGLGLMNGDVGVTLRRPDRLAVAFAAADRPGGVRWVAPSRLNQVETVFAMTVHKSQGSEFAHTAVLVPPNWSPVLTRELFYTGITRAKQRCSVVLAGAQSEQVLALTVRRRVLRASGLLSGA